jgi:integrase
MCNTGMRPSEAKNLRWRDVTIRKDREGRDVAVLRVSGKGKSRELVAPASVAEYLDRIRTIAKAKQPDDRVFTTQTGEPAKTLYKNMMDDLLTEAGLRMGPSGILRSTYSFRHTYATFRLSEGIDVYFLAEQMGTSVAMIEDHYGHVSPVKNADRILHGMTGWQPIAAEPEPEAPPKRTATRAGRNAVERSRRSRHRKAPAERGKTPVSPPAGP